MKHNKESIDATGSMYNHNMCMGCQLCHKGAKMVLFITGVCARDCFYCPLSEERKGKDAAYANERLIRADEDLIKEAELMSALGTGITGGEPLMKLDLLLHYIKLLKETFGEEHHIHLYTGIAPSNNVLIQLKDAGLDEIRFHPPVEDWDDFKASLFFTALWRAKKLGFDVGVEIPSIKRVPEIGDAVAEVGGFLNLNELEFSDTNCEALKERGYLFKDDVSNAVAGSEEIAHEIVLSIIANTRYCSSRFKDAVQLRERLKRTARNTARPFDEVSADGTIIYGEIVGNIIDALHQIEEMKVPRRMYKLYDNRIEIAWWILDDLSMRPGIGMQSSIVERYPMENGLVVERIPL